MPLLTATPASLREALRTGADRLYLNVAIKISLLRSWSSAPTEIWLKFFNPAAAGLGRAENES
jgi:hypothetical protein